MAEVEPWAEFGELPLGDGGWEGSFGGFGAVDSGGTSRPVVWRALAGVSRAVWKDEGGGLKLFLERALMGAVTKVAASCPPIPN